MLTLIQRCIISILLGFFSFSIVLPGVAAYTSSTRYSQKATKFVDSYVERMQRGGYSTAEITDALIALRSNYIKRQKSQLYSGSALSEIDAIIEELDSAIAGVSEGNCGTCDLYDPFSVYIPLRNQYVPNPIYPTRPTYPTYPYTPYTPSNTYQNTYQNTVSVANSVLSIDTSYTTQARTDLTLPSVNRDYDMYTFILQSGGYATSQPTPDRFISSSIIRRLNTAQNHTIAVSFGTEYSYDRVRNIRTLAENSIRNSLSMGTLASNYSDGYSSPTSDEFVRQSISNGSTRSYRTYRLYIARDNSNAFLVDYLETGTITSPYYGYGNGYNSNYNYGYGIYTSTISGIDTDSFTDYGSYFTHSYRMSNGSKLYKMYTYIPPAGSSVSNIYSNLGINSRTSYSMGTNRTQYVNGQYTNTSLNGYVVNSGYISAIESSFQSYGYSSSVTLPGSNSQINFSPLVGNSLSYSRLWDNSYRMYRLLVAEDGTDAYLTEYVQN